MGPKARHDSSEAGYPAELYAALHRGTEGDVDFYLRACSGQERVLELGCGYGRVLEPLAAMGHRVVGIERDPELAAIAREAVAPYGGRVIVGDMTSFELDELFDRVIVPFNGIYCLLDRDAVQRCFDNAR
ncbi:MAG: class I SAM-dependent methyltransferase, partial [Polyangiaceae bacterium]|nr:class I SAM-dependent methyltransferase [Polyangiaceae bacterium]